MENFIEQLKQSGLLGRSGSNFPVWKKWEAVKGAVSVKKFVICNASEGEPDVFKDAFILENYLPEVINGVKIAIGEVGASTAYIYLNKNFYQKFKQKIINLIDNSPIELFEKPNGYLAGEETAILNAIEGKRIEPRIKPPFPTEKGLWSQPTLINNVETFYWINKIAKGEYNHNRFYCISGETTNKGVFELPENYTIEQILKETKNYPTKPLDYFYQIGGGGAGEIMLDNELNQPIKGLASIAIFSKKTDLMALLMKWADFFGNENCDQCVPCREGFYRIKEILQQVQGKICENDKQTLQEIFDVLEKTSLCPFGRTAYKPFKSALEKLF
ncbi:MAG: NADH-ubiquinone oxidoreductase-F iron-sulfur binding region domain-containing protein [Candidatus Pacebacteria bacterium]|nr:NADH-ubiquinone oxidoreductase-F iron-sulfur binding region domain-containing protein [Candidatus Paceibacterota bacterium]